MVWSEDCLVVDPTSWETAASDGLVSDRLYEIQK